MSYVSVFLQGGLGNQLFMIFTTIAYSIKHSRKIIFTYDEVLRSGIERFTYWHSFLNRLEPYTTEKSIINNQDIYKFKQNYREHNFHFDDIPEVDRGSNLLLHGYFQSYKYFENYKEEIFELIDLRVIQDVIINKFSHYLSSEENIKIISMHFRIGDYITKQQYHPVIPYHYYNNAIIELKKNNISEGKILYFCENADNVTVNSHIEHLKLSHTSFEFIKVDDTIEDWEQMLIMSCCDVNIIANSTFSWFGAYLNFNIREHLVFYPSVWFGPSLQSHNLKDMFLPDWIKVDTN